VSVVDDDLADVAERVALHEVVNRMIAAIPRGLVIHQHVNVAAFGRVGDGERIGVADGERFLHHDVYAAARAGLDDSAMIVSGCVRQHSLGVRFLEHVVEAGVVKLGIEAELFRVSPEERLAGIGDADDLDVSAMKVLLEEAVNVSVDESDDGDAQGRSGLGGYRCSEENDREQCG